MTICSFRLRTPITKPLGRRLQTLLYARYSKEEQDASSIPDQYDYNQRFLAANGAPTSDISKIADPEMSGELAHRPGIDRVRLGIATRQWDLIVVEDSSRLFRHETACMQLVETAFDSDIRVIAINDRVDTAEEDWRERLRDVAWHHAKANDYTRFRIERKLRALWDMGAELTMVAPGHRRKSTNQDAKDPKKQGPHYDELDPKWAPVVYEAYERIAAKDPAWDVGDWLTEVGLPKRPNSKSNTWTDKNVIALIRSTIYRGLDQFRKTRRRKKHWATSQNVPNDADKVWTRSMEHLRIVPDVLWDAGNAAINGRTTRKGTKKGPDHPLAGLPRDSRGPLSGILLCGICEAKMIVDGRLEGGYRCSAAHAGRCWNKANPKRSVVHSHLGNAIADRLLLLDGEIDVLIRNVQGLLRDEGGRVERLEALRLGEKELLAARERLVDALETTGQPIEALTERLARRDEELAANRNEQGRIAAEVGLLDKVPTKEELNGKIRELANRIRNMDRAAAPDLRRLISTARAVPYQQFGTSSVVLRAHCGLSLSALLPTAFMAILKEEQLKHLDAQIAPIPLIVDLFEVTCGPARYWRDALPLHEAGLTSDEIASRLGTNRGTANRAVRYGKDLVAAGLADPFVELIDEPANPGRWRKRRPKQ